MDSLSTFTNVLNNWRKHNIFCDVVVQTSDVPLRAHSLILYAACPGLRHCLNPQSTNLQFVDCSRFPSFSVDLTLDFIYTGLANQPKTLEQSQLAAAHFEEIVKIFGFGSAVRSLNTDQSFMNSSNAKNVLPAMGQRPVGNAEKYQTSNEFILPKLSSNFGLENNGIITTFPNEGVDSELSGSLCHGMSMQTNPEIACYSSLPNVTYQHESMQDDQQLDTNVYDCVGQGQKFINSTCSIEDCVVVKEMCDNEGNNSTFEKSEPHAKTGLSLSPLGSGRLTKSLSDKRKKRHRCNKCGKSYDSAQSLSVHKYQRHSSSNQLNCDVCGITMSSKLNLLNHLSSHKGQEPHKCETCGVSFGSNRGLIMHMIWHAKKKSKKEDEEVSRLMVPNEMLAVTPNDTLAAIPNDEFTALPNEALAVSPCLTA